MTKGKRLDAEAAAASRAGDHHRASVLYAQAAKAHSERADKWLTVAIWAMGVAVAGQAIALIAGLIAELAG